MVAFSGVGGLPSVTLPSLCSFLSPVPTQLRSPLHLPPLCFLEEIDRQRHAHTHTSVHSAKGERVWRSLNSPSRRTSVWVRRTSAAMDGEEATSRFKRVCVFCGSNSGNRPVFSNAALDLGRELARRRIDLVYGGGSVGLMGLVSRTVFDGGCSVVGVIPAALMPQEISGETVGDVQVVSDMHERKAEMARQSDAFIALPGGYGTMEELLEMITWSQLGIHNKPVGLLNVDGYYDSLLALFDNGVSEGFIKPTARHIVVSAPTARELIMKMEQYAPSHVQVAPSQSWEIAHLGYTTLPRQT